jgi:uncharacterized protein YidB (DUF937 family)
MTISSISTSNTSQLFQAQRQQKPPTMDNTAKLLGLSSDDLQSELKNGKTLNDIASEKGVSTDDLTTAVKSDLKANKPADAPDLSDDQLTQMATDIEVGKRPHGHGHHGPKPASTSDDDDDDATTAENNLQTLASKVGLSQTDLLKQLTSGTSFANLLGSSGSTSNPYNAASYSGLGGVAVDEYA